jgi:hypothetical protein
MSRVLIDEIVKRLLRGVEGTKFFLEQFKLAPDLFSEMGLSVLAKEGMGRPAS